MKFYISTTGIKRVTISAAAAGAIGGGGKSRRIWSRSVMPVVLVLGLLLPFLFVRIAFFMLESAAVCSSSHDCTGWKIFSGSDTSLRLRDELTRALLEAKDGNSNVEGSLQSFNELVKDMTSNRQDIKAFAFKTKAMLLRMERNVQLAKQQESIYWHLASHGVPKSLHCFCLKLAEEYAVNAMARARLPSPEYVFRLIDPSFNHVVLLTDNVLAASVVVTSTIKHSVNPEKLVFHIVTDKKTYTPMHAWFATNSIKPAIVEVKGLHQYYWAEEVNVGVKEILEIHSLTWAHYYQNLKHVLEYKREHKRYTEALSPSCLSLLNHLRIYIPELFPDLKKIVFLDDDIVVQQDISSLWELDLNEKIIGAVVDSWCGDNCCPGRTYKDYLNFSHPTISSNFDDQERCAWLYGMNVFDLEAWRRSNITASYHHWLKLNHNSGFALWHPGALPPALIAFEGQVHPIDPYWHVTGLGHRSPEVPREVMDSAGVIHFSGPAKPWLEIGFPEARSLWSRHINLSNKFIRRCRVLG